MNRDLVQIIFTPLKLMASRRCSEKDLQGKSHAGLFWRILSAFLPSIPPILRFDNTKIVLINTYIPLCAS